MEESFTRTRTFYSGGLEGIIREKDGVLESMVVCGDTAGRPYQRIVIKDSWTEKYGGGLELSDLLELVKKMMEEVNAD